MIVDDLARARQSLKALIGTCPAVETIYEAESGQEAIRLMERYEPDALVMDIQMGEMNGLDAARVIKSRWPSTKVIVLSMFSDYEQPALAAGADAFVSKTEPPALLIGALEAVTGSSC